MSTIDLCKEPHAKATYVSDTKVWCSEQSLPPDDVQLIRGSCDFGATCLKVSFSFVTSNDLHASAVSQYVVRRICVFLLVSGVNESYEVMKKLLELVDINTLMHFFTTRLVWAQATKMNWLFSGKTHGGVFSCNVCWRRSSHTFDDQQKLLTFGENAAEAA